MNTILKTPLMLSGEQLSCQRGERVLFARLDLSVGASECLHIVGANGSGKTSLLRILCGLAEADSGQVSWGKTSAINNQDYLRQSAYIGHKDALKNELTAIENLRISQQLDGEYNEQALDQCLNQLQILDCADLLAQSLSFGQRRRLSFAKLLLKPKQLWILDEPFTGIDQDGRALIESLCLNHLQSGGIIVLTHHQSLESSSLAPHLIKLTLASTAEHQSVA